MKQIINVFTSFCTASGNTDGVYTYHFVVAENIAERENEEEVLHRFFTVKFKPKDSRFFLSNLNIDFENAQKRRKTIMLSKNPVPHDLQSLIDKSILKYLKKFESLKHCVARKTGEKKPNSRYKTDIIGQFFFEEGDAIGTLEDWELHQEIVGAKNVRKIYADGKFIKIAAPAVA